MAGHCMKCEIISNSDGLSYPFCMQVISASETKRRKIMNNLNAKKTVTIPVPANYVKDTMIAGVSTDDIRKIRFGEVEVRVFFVDVPEEQAGELLKFTWAEFNYDQKLRRRREEGLIDCGLEEIECCVESTWLEDPLQQVIQKEIAGEQEKIIAYLESKHEYYGEIYRERLNGNFSLREMERRLKVPACNLLRWSEEVSKLAAKYYFKNFF